MRGTPRDPRNYELMTVFSPDVPEDEIQGTIDRVVGYITSASGEIVHVSRDSPWGRRRLAYPIRHASRDVRDGFYTLYHFLVAPHRVVDIEREIKLNDRIMRYLVTVYTPKPVEEPAAAEGGGEPAPTGEAAEAAVAEVAEAEVAEAAPQVASADEAPAGEVAPPAEPEAEAAAEPIEAAEPVEDVADTEEAAPPEEE